MDFWIGWDELNQLTADKKIVFFGSGEWAEKTLRKLGKMPEFIMDNSEVMQGTKFDGVPVRHPNMIFNEEKVIILITTGSFESVVEQLDQMGFKKSVDYFMSPVLLNNRIEIDMKTYSQELIFTCSDIPDKESKNSGGGLYIYNTRDRKLEKKVSGKFHEFVETPECYYVMDEFYGVRKFSKQFKLLESFPAAPGGIMHGLTYDPDTNRLFVANTGRDSVTIMDAITGKHLEEYYISYPNDEGEVDRHHINDLCYYKGELYISMFSFSGLWREGCYDGGVLKVKLDSDPQHVSYPIKDMWMPHSIDFVNGEVIIADSMRGTVYKTNNNELVHINGFIRGLAYDGRYYFIGQSEHRYFDRLKGISNNISVNCGIHMYDDVHKASRFHPFMDMRNIHSIKVYNGNKKTL